MNNKMYKVSKPVKVEFNKSSNPFVQKTNKITYKQLQKQLEKKIKKDFGKECKTFHINCFVCRAYLMLSILDDYVATENE